MFPSALNSLSLRRIEPRLSYLAAAKPVLENLNRGASLKLLKINLEYEAQLNAING